MLKFTKREKGAYTATTKGITFEVYTFEGIDGWKVTVDGDFYGDYTSIHTTKKEAVAEANRLASDSIDSLIEKFGG